MKKKTFAYLGLHGDSGVTADAMGGDGAALLLACAGWAVAEDFILRPVVQDRKSGAELAEHGQTGG